MMDVEPLVRRALEAVAAGLKAALMAELGKQRLSTSELAKGLKVEVEDDELSLFVADYAAYIEGGRKALARRVPINVILTWIKQKGISSGHYSTLSLAFAIQTSIYKHGLKPRPFVAPALDRIEQLTEDAVTDLLNDAFDVAIATWKP